MRNNLTKPMPRSGKHTAVLNAFIVYQAPLRRFISRFLRCPYDVEDVAQEAFLRAYSTEKERKIEQPKSFLFRIAKHIALTQLTQKSRQITDYIEDFDNSDVLLGGDSTEDEVIARQTLGIHCEAIAELPPQCRRVYIMRKVYGMSHKEIAGRMGISVSTVEKHLIKGVKQCDHYVRLRTEKNHHPIQQSSRVKS
jgi:RNA polymerase sigma factor (sigma-70 family)